MERGFGSWIFNNSLLKDLEFVTLLRNELRSSANIKHTYESKRVFWDFLNMNIQSVARMFATEKAEKKRTEIWNIKKEIAQLERLHVFTITEETIAKLTELKGKLAVFEKNKIEGLKLRTKIASYEIGEPKIAFLAKLEKTTGEKNSIFSLKDDLNFLKEGTDNLLKITYDFYKKLYTKEPESELEQDYLLSKVRDIVSTDQLEASEKNIEASELFKSLTDLQPNKSPGMNGITRELYIFFWPELEEHYTDCIREIMEKNELSEMQKKGAIRITHKKGNRDELKNYRPITLLNVDLKILTRTLAKRLANILPSLIHKSQRAVPGRQIRENIHIVQDLIDLINKNDEEAAFLFFDQEKAFDRMSHKFIIKTLTKFGFGDKFIKWVKILCNDTKSFVKVNGFETTEFDIERGLRQGCALSALLYVLVAEVLGINLRTNRKIKGYKYGNQEYKSSQYADDLIMCITDVSSIKEVFEVFGKYERATNSKLNRSKTEALWVGKWKNRTDTPYNLKWNKYYSKCLGVFVGNKLNNEQRLALANRNFAEIEAKINNKLAFWKGLGLSTKAKVRVVNMFALSKLFYRLEHVDIPNCVKTEIEKKIKGFIWNDKKAGRVEPNALSLGYEKGGLQLYDIDLRIKAMRIKWLDNLIKLDDKEIERHIVDKLIGDHRGISGLKILDHDIELTKFPNINYFYRNAIKIWRSMNILFEGSNINSIKNEIIYHNTLLLDNNNVTFKFFSLANTQRYIPKYIRDLPVTTSNTSISRPHREKIAAINRAFWVMRNQKLGKFAYNCYAITIGDTNKNLEEIPFKELYNIMIERKDVNKIWEPKWNRLLRYYTLDIDVAEWEQIWNNVHDNIISYDIQSTIWNMLHLNFYCGYKEKMFNYGDGKCKLCGVIEEGSHHIILECAVMKACLNDHQNILLKLHNELLCKDEMAFGLVGNPIGRISGKIKLRNFLTFIIRHVVFKNRYIDFGGILNAHMILKTKILDKIKTELLNKWIAYRNNAAIEGFANKYLIENILGHLENDKLVFTF